MRLTGFIKEYNNIKEAVGLTELISVDSNSGSDIEKIVKYLNNGVLLLAWMGYFIDEKTNKLIAPDSYLTDGIWIWPAYYPYYLQKYPSMRIDTDFLAHLENRNFELRLDEKFHSQKPKLENELSKKLNTAS